MSLLQFVCYYPFVAFQRFPPMQRCGYSMRNMLTFQINLLSLHTTYISPSTTASRICTERPTRISQVKPAVVAANRGGCTVASACGQQRTCGVRSVPVPTAACAGGKCCTTISGKWPLCRLLSLLVVTPTIMGVVGEKLGPQIVALPQHSLGMVVVIALAVVVVAPVG